MKFRLTSEFGELHPVRNWQPHTGIDLAIPENSKLRSIGEGVIDKIFNGEGSLGKGLSIKFEDGSRAIYGHMNDVTVKIGEKVNAGDFIGLSGNTGNSTGPHLHFGLKDANGNFVDPAPLAEKVANFSGDQVQLGVIPKLMGLGAESIRKNTADIATEIILGILDAVKDILQGATLIGAGLLILFKVAGWKDGGRWAGVLIVANILLKALFGGI